MAARGRARRGDVLSLTDPVVEPLRTRVAELETANAGLRREVGVLQRRLARALYLARIRGVAISRNDLLGPEQREAALKAATR